MTYGWAILLLLVIIGALFQTGAINIGSRMKDTAYFPPPFRVEDFSVSDDKIKFLIKNDQPNNITVLPYGYESSGDCNITSIDAPGEVGAYEYFNINFYCKLDQDRIVSRLSFLHNNSVSGNIHRSTGEIIARR